MTYFLIIPAYIGLLLLATLAAVVVRFVPSMRHTSAYIGTSALVSVPMVLLANLLLWALVLGPVYLANGMTMPQAGKSALGILVLIALTIGPVIVTPIGIILAVLLAWRLVRKKRTTASTAHISAPENQMPNKPIEHTEVPRHD